MWTLRSAFQTFLGIVIWAPLILAPVAAQQAQPEAAQKQPYGGGTPVDVILHTRLWVDPPKMQPFVRAARPPENSLNYISTQSKSADPKRPPLRTASELEQVQNQLENAGAHAERAAGFKTRHFAAEANGKSKGNGRHKLK